MANDSTTADFALVGDFGGTNVRLALADLTQATPALSGVRHYLSRDFAKADDTIAAYLSEQKVTPRVVVVAAAGPVIDGSVRFTNLGWTLSEASLRGLGFAGAHIINDFVALALSTRVLTPADVRQIGGGNPDRTRNIAVMGAGTGFGASALAVGAESSVVALAAEAGHASFAPDDEVEIEILRILRKRFDHVSVERILSGPGLAELHQALNAIEHVSDDAKESQTITERALAGETLCSRTIERFCAMLGGVAGNLALTYGATGGIYIAGGIVPRFVSILERSEFRRRFESKGRFAAYLRPIATQIIIRPDAAFLGAARVARDWRR